MDIDKAIKDLEDIVAGDIELGRDEFVKAERLGIEALKLNKIMRETYAHPELLILPGETEE